MEGTSWTLFDESYCRHSKCVWEGLGEVMLLFFLFFLRTNIASGKLSKTICGRLF